MLWRDRADQERKPRSVPRHRRTHPITAIALIVCTMALGIGGMVGGIVFLIDPSGAELGLDTDLLDGTPISDYVLPGLFILVAFGLVPFVVAYGLARRPHWAPFDWIERKTGDHWSWLGVVVLALALMVWIAVEIAYIGVEAPIQVVCGGLGLVMLVLAMLPQVRRFYAGT